MARHSNIITADENDIISLQKLASGLDSNLAIRAKIILESINHPKSSESARILGVDQRSVSLWKKRYQEYGIKGLVKTYGGGPQGKQVEFLEARLLERVQQSEQWTVSVLAQEFETTEYMIRKALTSMGIELQRVHTWCCNTTDVTKPKSFSVHALFLSYDAQALVLFSAPPSSENVFYSGDCGDEHSGVFVTHNRLLANDINSSATTLGLADILIAATDHCHDVLRASRPTLSSFLETVIQDIPNDALSEYHVYAHADKQPNYRGISAAHITYSDVQTADEWKSLTTAWINGLTDFAQRQDAAALLCAVEGYMKQCEPSTEPFCWNKKGSIKASMKEANTKNMLQKSAEHLLEQMNSEENATQVGAVIVLRDKNGISTQEVIGKETLPELEELDFSSPEALGRTLGKAERSIDSFVRDLALKLEQQYANDAKKNEVE